LIGNDIIDLVFVESPAYSHVDHLNRVCTSFEVSAVRASSAPATKFAELWASKEAAYKLLAKRDASLRFIPKRFEVHFGTEVTLNYRRDSEAGSSGSQIHISLFVTQSWVHAVAVFDPRRRIRWCVSAFEANAHHRTSVGAESAAVRRLGQQFLAEHASPDMRLEFAGRVPIISNESRGEPRIGISLSHHGRYAAAAIAWLDESSLPQGTRAPLFSASASEEACFTCMA
jgi:phosphopantetheinyl transferase (holo-ACP synthase)